MTIFLPPSNSIAQFRQCPTFATQNSPTGVPPLPQNSQDPGEPAVRAAVARAQAAVHLGAGAQRHVASGACVQNSASPKHLSAAELSSGKKPELNYAIRGRSELNFAQTKYLRISC